MNPIERLRRDHQLLEKKLGMLQGAAELFPQSRLVLREGCYSVTKFLRDHSRREAKILAGLDTPPHQREGVEHEERLQSLRLLTRYLGDAAATSSVSELRAALSEVVEGLRHELQAQDEELFPALERVAQRGPSRTSDQPSPRRLHEDMTVDRIVHLFPETKPVFDRIFVNLAYEGYDCLDEVAWRHGMQPEGLLEELEAAASRQPHARSQR